MNEYKEERNNMVDLQLAGRDITDQRVLDVFRKIERHLFVREFLKADAYGDFPLSTGCGQTISQPYMVALMTQCLNLTGTEKVLEIGTGSGYQTAILAELAKEIFSIEKYKELADSAKERLLGMGYSNIHIQTGDGTLGWNEFAPFDRIIVTAAAPYVPDTFKEQLAEGGRIVIPVGGRFSQVLITVDKKRGKFIENEVCGCVFVPLVGKYGYDESAGS